MLILLFPIVLFIAGLFGMMGLAGGVIYVPLLSWWGLDFATGAIPLSLLLGTATGLSASYTYMRGRFIHFRVGLAASSTVLIGSPVGAWAARGIPTGILKIIFATVAGYVATRIIRSVEPSVPMGKPTRRIMGWVIFIGFFVGFSSALLGIGGTFILIPFLLATGYPTKEAAATSSMVVTLSTFASFLYHLPHASFPLPAAALLVPAAFIGSRLGGVWASRHAQPRTLRFMVGTIILLVSVKIAVEGILTVMG